MSNDTEKYLSEYLKGTFNADYNQAYNEITKGKGYRHADIFYSFAQAAARHVDEPLLLSVVGSMYFMWRKEHVSEGSLVSRNTTTELQCYKGICALIKKIGVLAKRGYYGEPVLYKIKGASIKTDPCGGKITCITFDVESVRISSFGIILYSKGCLTMEEFVECLHVSLTALSEMQCRVRRLSMGFQNIKEIMQTSKCLTNKDVYEINEALDVIKCKLEGKTALINDRSGEISHYTYFNAKKDITVYKANGLEINPIKTQALRTLVNIIGEIAPLNNKERDSVVQQFTEIEDIINDFLNK